MERPEHEPGTGGPRAPARDREVERIARAKRAWGAGLSRRAWLLLLIAAAAIAIGVLATR